MQTKHVAHAFAKPTYPLTTHKNDSFFCFRLGLMKEKLWHKEYEGNKEGRTMFGDREVWARMEEEQ